MSIGGLEKMLGFGNKYKTETEHLENNSRRDFLKSTSKGALVLGLTGTGFLKSEDALAYFEMKNLPPGIQIIKDEALITAYGSMIYGGYNESRIYNILTRTGGWIEGNMKKETPLLEPGYWFILNHYDYKFQSQGNRGIITADKLPISLSDLERKNLPMFYWNKGISMYFKTWADNIYRNKHGSSQETEIYLARAFILASGRPEQDYEPFLERIKNKNLDSFMVGVMNSLKSQTNLNRLIAGWSIFFLTLNEANKTNSKNEISNFIKFQIEERLINNNIIPKIRGPPKYNI